MTEMTCPVCGKKFTPRRGGTPQKYCSYKCKQKFHNDIAKEKRRRKLMEERRTCPTCGVEFTPRAGKQKYCSIRCRTIYWKQKEPTLAQKEHKRQYNKKWNQDNREHLREYQRKRHKLRTAHFFLYGQKKTKSHRETLGFLNSMGFCPACGTINPFSLQTHHLLRGGEGFALTLCANCHQEGHRLGWEHLFEEERGKQLHSKEEEEK